MARLVYYYFTALDGHVADEKGKFDWAEPDEAVLEFVDLQEFEWVAWRKMGRLRRRWKA